MAHGDGVHRDHDVFSDTCLCASVIPSPIASPYYPGEEQSDTNNTAIQQHHHWLHYHEFTGEAGGGGMQPQPIPSAIRQE